MAAANRTVVKNYNAANRAINRAPAWVKWTIAAIAIAIIGYALWKVFFAPRREGMTFAAAPQDWVMHGGIDMMNCGDVPGFASSRKTLEEAVEGCNAAGEGCDGFAFDIGGSNDGKGQVYHKKINGTCTDNRTIQCNTNPNVAMYVKLTKNAEFEKLPNCKAGALVTAAGGDGGCFEGNG